MDIDDALAAWAATMIREHGFTLAEIDAAMEIWLRAGDRWPMPEPGGFRRNVPHAE